jgi:hypothetical protein
MRPEVMREYAVASVILSVLAVGGIVALRPDPAVRFEAELSRLEPEGALRELRAVDGRMTFHANLELLYGHLSLADGDLEGARRSFGRLLRRADPSEEVLETLAHIEALSGNLAHAATYLSQVHQLAPTDERRLRLGAWYRTLRRPEAERVLLASVDPTALTPWEVERLGVLLLDARRLHAYEDLLTRLAEQPGAEGLPAKQRLLEYLVEVSAPSLAVAAATRWAQQPKPGPALETSVRALIGRGAIDAAILVARAGIAHAPREAHAVLPVFARSGHGGLARMLQDEWLATRDSLSEAEWATLSLLAESTGDMRALHKALSMPALRAGPQVTGQALMQFVRYRGAQALLPYRGLLDQATCDAVPLMGAAWAAWRGDQAQTYRHLVAASAQPLSEWDQLIWMSLFDSLRGSPFQRRLLEGAVTDPALRQRMREGVIPLRPANAAASASAARPG